MLVKGIVKRTTLSSPAALALVVLGLLATAPIGSITAKEKTTTLNGTYVWSQRGGGGDLEAVFTATGKNTWDVSFHFEFRDKPHTYTGTAEGSLGDGTLSGQVFNENKRRTFTFDGEFKNGTFEGTHAETTGGSPIDTGTLTLSK